MEDTNYPDDIEGWRIFEDRSPLTKEEAESVARSHRRARAEYRCLLECREEVVVRRLVQRPLVKLLDELKQRYGSLLARYSTLVSSPDWLDRAPAEEWGRLSRLLRIDQATTRRLFDGAALQIPAAIRNGDPGAADEVERLARKARRSLDGVERARYEAAVTELERGYQAEDE